MATLFLLYELKNTSSALDIKISVCMSACASSTVSSSIHALFTFCLLGSFSAEPVGAALLHLHPYSTSMGRLFGKQSTVDHHSNSWDVLLREVTAMHTCSMNSLKVHSS